MPSSPHAVEPELAADTPSRRHVAVIGAGVTGLVAARELAAAGCQVTVLERSDRAGGQLEDVEVARHRVDVGAESLFTAAPGPLELIADLGLDDEVVPAARGTTWIWTPRGLRCLPQGFTPAGPSRLLPVLRSRVLSLRGMARAACEPLIAAAPARGVRGQGSDGAADRSVGHVLERRFGRELTDRLVDPLLGGLHAGDVRTLSLQAATPQLAALLERHRSLLLRRRPAPRHGPAFVTLRTGLTRLTDRLLDDLAEQEVRFGTQVRRIRRAGSRLVVEVRADRGHGGDGHVEGGSTRSDDAVEGGGSRSDDAVGGGSTRRDDAVGGGGNGDRPTDRAQHGGSGPTLVVDGVVLATPAHVAASIVADASPEASRSLGELRAASVAVAALAYPKAAITGTALEGSTGLLMPSTSPHLLKAATFLSTKWPQHEHDDVVLVRASAGRIGDDRPSALDDDALVDRLHRELAEVTGLQAVPLDAVVRCWPETMPQLEVGHHARLATATSALADDLPGVVLAGAPYLGPGLSSCLRSASKAVRSLLSTSPEAVS